MPGADAPHWMNHADTLSQLAEKLDININNFNETVDNFNNYVCLLYTSPSPRDSDSSRMPSSA